MNAQLVSKLQDADMQAAPKALLRAAQRAREIARQTHTALVVMRNGVLVEEAVTDTLPVNEEQERTAQLS